MRLGLVTLVALVVGCRAESSRSAPVVGPVSCRLEIAGQAPATLDAARLAAVERIAERGGDLVWRLAAVVGPAVLGPDVVVEVEGATGVKVVFSSPGQPVDGRELMLVARSDGSVIVTRLGLADPLAELAADQRPGAPHRRIPAVQVLRVRSSRPLPPEPGPATAVAKADGTSPTVEVIDGDKRHSLTAAELDAIPDARRVVAPGTSAAAAPSWRLATILHHVAGRDARACRVQPGDRELELETRRSPKRELWLGLNRRGEFLLHWVDPGGRRLGAPLRDVRSLVIEAEHRR